MEFTINRDIFLKSLNNAYGIIEKKTTLPILSNILIEAKDSKIRITATDLDIIYSEVINLQQLILMFRQASLHKSSVVSHIQDSS